MTGSDEYSADVSAGGLAGALAALEDRWRELDLPVAAGLQPGLSEEEIRSAWAARGLVPPAEIITWFSWHDGSLPGHPGMPGTRILNLERTLEFQEIYAMGPEHGHWIPITADRGGASLCVSAAHPEAGPAKVTFLLKVPEPRDEPYTLEQVVRVWGDRFDRGDWYREGDNVEYRGDHGELLPSAGEERSIGLP